MVKIVREGKQCKVQSPYLAEFVSRAKEIGGTWEPMSKSWVFSSASSPAVKKLCIELYGTDGELSVETKSVQIELSNNYYDGQSLTFAGRTIAYRYGRDYPARLGNGVGVIQGGFPPSGGSMKNPRLNALSNSVFIVEDVPISLIEKAIEDNKEGGDWASITILEV